MKKEIIELVEIYKKRIKEMEESENYFQVFKMGAFIEVIRDLEKIVNNDYDLTKKYWKWGNPFFNSLLM